MSAPVKADGDPAETNVSIKANRFSGLDGGAPANQSSGSEPATTFPPENHSHISSDSDLSSTADYDWNPGYGPAARRGSQEYPGLDLEKQRSRASQLVADRTGGLIKRIRSQPNELQHTHSLSHVKTGADVLVKFSGPDDPYHPLNWPFQKKAIHTALYGLTTMVTGWSTSVYTPGASQVQAQLGVSRYVALLPLTSILIGLGLGPLISAPLSELYGRKSSVVVPFFVSSFFIFGAGAAQNIETLIITRFFAGLFGSAPISNVGGVLADIWVAEERGIAFIAYAIAVVLGPLAGPVVGAALVDHPGLGWRWAEYVTGIMILLFTALDLIFLDETYPPVMLQRKAAHLRFMTGNWALHSMHEERELSFRDLGRRYMVRPWQLMATPICLLVVLYSSFCYGILFSLFSVVPLVFGGQRHWEVLPTELPLFGTMVGVLIAALINYLNNKYYIRRMRANGNKPVPEARLPPMMIGGFFFAGGIFTVGWTADLKYPFMAPIVGLAMIGLGFFAIFQSALNYLVDTFKGYSASAVAVNTFLRSIFAAVLPLVVGTMYSNLTTQWGSSLFGFIAVAMIPIPFLFNGYGARIRAAGKWSRDSTL